MESHGTEIDHILKLYVENDLEISENGNFTVNTLLFIADEEDPIEAKNSFESIIGEVISLTQHDGVNNYTELYNMAHELSRNAERLRAAATTMEDSVLAMSDLFDNEDRLR